jgi:hypothetical protein
MTTTKVKKVKLVRPLKSTGTVEHVGGNYYQATNLDGGVFFGNKSRAEEYAAGTYAPQYRSTLNDAVDLPEIAS